MGDEDIRSVGAATPQREPDQRNQDRRDRIQQQPPTDALALVLRQVGEHHGVQQQQHQRRLEYEIDRQEPPVHCDVGYGQPVALEGDDAIAKHRDLMGATDPKKAAPGTIRADFAQSIDANAVHGSDGVDTARGEIAYFFADLDICPR